VTRPHDVCSYGSPSADVNNLQLLPHFPRIRHRPTRSFHCLHRTCCPPSDRRIYTQLTFNSVNSSITSKKQKIKYTIQRLFMRQPRKIEALYGTRCKGSCSFNCTLMRMSENGMNHAFAFPAEAGPHFTDPKRMEG